MDRRTKRFTDDRDEMVRPRELLESLPDSVTMHGLRKILKRDDLDLQKRGILAKARGRRVFVHKSLFLDWFWSRS